MDRIHQHVRLDETEVLEITADMMSHPFHVHGITFQVLSKNGRPVEFGEVGMKDVVWGENSAEFLVRFDKPATADAPFMYRCHILEHGNSGMSRKFTFG
jgi:blue copper oxidase